MKHQTVNRSFQLVGISGKGPFAEFGSIVPNVANEVMARSGEIGLSSFREIAVFEAKKSDEHLQGEFIAGLMVDKPVHDVPAGMTYTSVTGHYATSSGNIERLPELHADLIKWTADNGHLIDQSAPIIEIYIPRADGEDVEIYLPILSR